MSYNPLYLGYNMGRVQRTPKGPFQDMCFELRTRHRLRHKHTAEAMGVAVSTAGNVEYSRFRVVSDEKAAKLADLYKLGPNTTPTRAAFMAASAALPISEYTQAQREDWKRRNLVRSKSRRFDMMLEAIDDIVCMLGAEGRPCTCTPELPGDFDVEPTPATVCPLCKAMQAMGIPEGYSSPDLAFARIAQFHETRKASAKAAGAQS